MLVCKKYSLPQSQHFSTLGKTLLPKMRHCITPISLYMNRQRHGFPLFLEGRAAPSVIKSLTQQVSIPSPGSAQASGDRSAGAVLLCQGTVQANSPPSLFHTGTHSQSPGKPLPASVPRAFETLNRVFNSALT